MNNPLKSIIVMKRLFFLSTMALLCLSQSEARSEDDSNIFTHLSVGMTLGLDGIGFEAAAPLTGYCAVRMGYTFMPKFKIDKSIDLGRDPAFVNYSDNDRSMTQDMDIEGKLNIGNFKLLFDAYPSRSSSFHFTAGAYIGTSNLVEAYNTAPFLKQSSWGNKGIELGTGADTYTVVSDLAGNVKAEVKTNSFKPYLGIGFGRAVPKGRVGVQCDLGVQFWGRPEVWANINCVNTETGYLETKYQKVNKSRITNPGDDYQDLRDAVKTIEKFTFYPVLNIRVSGRIF